MLVESYTMSTLAGNIRGAFRFYGRPTYTQLSSCAHSPRIEGFKPALPAKDVGCPRCGDFAFMKQLTQREKLIRAAALIDTDGCIEISSDRGGVRCSFCSVEATIPDWLMREYGGSVYVDNKTSKSLNARTAYRWVICAQKACDFIRLICPFLMIKSKQANLALEYRKVQEDLWSINGKYRQKYRQNRMAIFGPFVREMQQLNRRGK